MEKLVEAIRKIIGRSKLSTGIIFQSFIFFKIGV
jgi:hypothetical protein